MTVLVTGAGGQVGRAVVRAAPSAMPLQALTHEALDVSDAAAVHAAVAGLRPSLIINAAAYTAVDRAESEPDRAYAINAAGARHLAEAAQAVAGCRLIQLSTDYVFDGRGTRPYLPQDLPNPQSVYGRTKLEGERLVHAMLGERAVVLRTAWVYAERGHNFVLTMLRLMRERGAVRVVADQRGTPTAAAAIAQALWRLVERPAVHGMLHWTDAGETSWYGFACAIAQEAAAVGLLRHVAQVTPIGTADYPTPAQRPAYSVLDTRDSAAQLGLSPVPWREQLGRTLAELVRIGEAA